jgi:hypothetical protein
MLGCIGGLGWTILVAIFGRFSGKGRAVFGRDGRAAGPDEAARSRSESPRTGGQAKLRRLLGSRFVGGHLASICKERFHIPLYWGPGLGNGFGHGQGRVSGATGGLADPSTMREAAPRAHGPAGRPR